MAFENLARYIYIIQASSNPKGPRRGAEKAGPDRLKIDEADFR